MEINRKRVVRELDELYHHILNNKLADKITEREIMAIINAAALLVEDDKRISKLTEENERLQNILAKAERTAEYSEDFGCFVVQLNELIQIGEEGK